MRLKGGKIKDTLNCDHDQLNALIAKASGSGWRDMYLGSCLLFRAANKSMSGNRLKSWHKRSRVPGGVLNVMKCILYTYLSNIWI